MSDGELILLAIFCSRCGDILDVVNADKNPIYIDKNCECGSAGFYTQEIKVKIVVLTERPKDRKPLFEWDGQEFY